MVRRGNAHLVAVMQVYSVTDILTFNVEDSRRFPGITVLDPAQFQPRSAHVILGFRMTMAIRAPSSLSAVSIEGSPVLSGRTITPADPELLALGSLQEYAEFARKLRGQFSIVVRQGGAITAITDFIGSLPLYYIRTKDVWHVATRLPELRPYSDGRLSRAALFFFAARGSIGIDPCYAGVQQIFPGTVMRFEKGDLERTSYVDWHRMGAEQQYDDDQALRAFTESTSSYLAAVTSKEERVGCLLSGGTDSAIAAWLLKRLGCKVVCFTADYAIDRYSEYEVAHRHAMQLGVEHKRILVNRKDHWSAFRRINSAESDQPTCHSQLSSLYKISEAARDLGIRVLVNGDNADTLFMGLEGFFKGLPEELSAYSKYAAELGTEEKLDRVIRWNPLDDRGASILAALHVDKGECEKWIDGQRNADRELFRPFASQFPLWRFQQVVGQYWAGVPYQSCWLPAERMVNGVQFVSPFLDAEVVQLGLSLPIELKFRNGVRKFLLHKLLERETGIQVQKCSSPNPSRLWTLFPDAALVSRIDPRLRKIYLKYCVRNIASKGALHWTVSNIAALGTWMRDQGIENVEG
jgi:asparagine synthase (glutamine-hydrolysing)